MLNKNIQLLVSLLLVSLLTSTSLSAQIRGNSDGLMKVDEDLFVGGLSPNILQTGDIEVNFYTALFSNWIAIHESVRESRIQDRLRLTDFSTNIEAYYGISNSERWDIGLRLKQARRRLDNSAQSSPFEVFKKEDSESENIGVDKTYSGTREVGLRFRFIPFGEIENLSINAGYSFSPARSEEVQQYLGADRNSFDVNAAYYISLNESGSSYYYFTLNGIAYIPTSVEEDLNPYNDQWLYNAGGSFFILQRIGKLLFYPGLSYSVSFKPPSVEGKTLIRTSDQVLGLLGLQVGLSDNFSLNVTAAAPLILRNTNNLVQPVRESYSFVSIGGRILFNR